MMSWIESSETAGSVSCLGRRRRVDAAIGFSYSRTQEGSSIAERTTTKNHDSKSSEKQHCATDKYVDALVEERPRRSAGNRTEARFPVDLGCQAGDWDWGKV